MARPREFDRDQVLEKALELFWRRGFEATSIADLVTATGVQRQSLYDTFGDKQGLYDAALDLYAQKATALPRALEDGEGSPLALLRRAFSAVVEDPMAGRGCMLVNASVERGASDPHVAACAGANIDAIERAFFDLVVRAKASGEVGEEVKPRAAARLLVTLLWGLRAMGSVRPDAAWQKNVVDQTLGLLRTR